MLSWIPLASFGLNVLVLLVSITGFIKIMKNDLYHLEKSVKELTIILKEISTKMNENSERIAKIEGKCLANHGS